MMASNPAGHGVPETPASLRLPPPMSGEPIVTARLVLRLMTTDDIATVVGYRSRPAVYAYLSHGGNAHGVLEEKFRRRVDRMSEPDGDASEVQLVVERRDPGAADAAYGGVEPATGADVIGDCGFRVTRAWTKDDAPTRHLVARIHYALDDTEAGQGYGTEAVRALVGHLFAQPGVHRIQADVFADNTASRRVLAKVGFRQEGYFVDDGLIDGRFVDACIYSLLRREWQGFASNGS